jgi:amidase
MASSRAGADLIPARFPTLSDLRSGDISCEEVARGVLSRIAEREPEVHAWAFVDEEAVLEQARALDRATVRGALHGVPVGIKDVIDTQDMPTQMGSPIYAGYRPRVDAACVALVRAAGALIVGKTVTAEFAGTAPGPTANPLDLRRTPGGSSSGSAAAVADGMVPVALGTQTGGSIHRPASYCGVVGFKPTQSAVNRAGVKAAAERFDTVGIIAQDFDYINAVLRVLTNGAATNDLLPQKPSRAGACRTPFWERAQPETIAAFEVGVNHLREAGVRVSDIYLPVEFATIGEARATINDFQRAHALRSEWQSQPELFSLQLAAVIRRGLNIDFERYAAAIERVRRCRAAFDAAFGNLELLIAPCVDGEAPIGLASTGEHHFQSLWTTIDVPTASLPVYTAPSGMPVSIQLVGRPWKEHELMRQARWLSGLASC